MKKIITSRRNELHLAWCLASTSLILSSGFRRRTHGGGRFYSTLYVELKKFVLDFNTARECLAFILRFRVADFYNRLQHLEQVH